MTHGIAPQQIDIEKILASKSRRLAKFVPNFVINYIKRIVHQNEINAILSRYSDKEGVEFAGKVLEELNVTCTVKYINKDSILPDKRYIFVSNHPLGGLDGIVLIKEIGAMYNNKIKFVVNDLLLNLQPLKEIFVPVNKHGSMSKEYSKLINEAYSSENQILYFPAGLCSRKTGGTITDLEWKTNYLKQALKHERSIVPIHFNAANSNLFYRLANIRKLLGIKFNFEMIYLPDEMFKKKNTNFEVIIGKPIEIDEIKSNPDIKFWNEKIRSISYSLK